MIQGLLLGVAKRHNGHEKLYALRMCVEILMARQLHRQKRIH
jgi:hypothetical protein